MRIDSRTNDQLRKIEIHTDINKYAEGSLIISFGDTKVLITVSLEEKLPQWLTGKDSGWITAEYNMLPRANQKRSPRDSILKSGRTHEIQRLIGRSIRAVTDLALLKDKSIIIDCDVLQADGGTRTCSITGAYIAVQNALKRLHNMGVLPAMPLKEPVAAVSAGIVNGEMLLDLNYYEDSNAELDLNLVMTESQKIVEFQCTSEKRAVSKDELDRLFLLAQKGILDIIKVQKGFLI
ncbi:MAG: ribonuclease PH [Deltaproteobacteria bacterium]|nr:ribonuclease PH [Deltaproteobacteria bacterium]